ncbi:MAG TPA: DUF401 family protein [candidate division Zixibacteria bacterium]|nr:DUF401 family protein [candidate division Zixibacteria bacterium]MDD4918646.1 DUF401 family protein [candidate division Zixibacteria bacterium]MDM7971740.1 DUF401 family protein [candidate division Zixibacteria bacterium]HOD67155.1 DUF401 family protein [candidate division Zixibacteria bacterium]HPM38470.1 DUF401 family protein [candidate division Zixibacteria bacterium]
MLTTWLGFGISLAVILAVASRTMPAALLAGAFVLGLTTLPWSVFADRVTFTLTDPAVLLLAAAMAMVPMIGGAMRQSGQVDALVRNLRVRQRWLLPLSASMMGLLPMPGGALLSAPIVEKAGGGVPDELKAAINNWFRHLFILIYPLSPALIASSKIAGVDVYAAMLHLLPGSLLSVVLGYFFYLRQVNGPTRREGRFSWAELALPLAVVLAAPVLDFTLKRAAGLGNLATVIGTVTAFGLSAGLSRERIDLTALTRRARPWNFALIIIGMFLYVNVFVASDIRELIAALPLPTLILALAAGFGLGFGTGRVDLSSSIIFPIYLAGAGSVTPSVFALIYAAVFFGYMISPVHPCLVVTSEYFKVPVRKIMRRHAAPTAAVLGIVLTIAGVLLAQ